MSTFKKIRGQLIRSLSSDPSPAATGEMWYNSTSQTLKGVVLAGAWSSGGTLGTARQGLASVGPQTAALAFAGRLGNNNATNSTETYNGSSWTTSGGTINNSRFALAGAGTQTAGLAFGGNPTTADSEEYNGTSWTEGNNLNTARTSLAGAGIQTAALAFGVEGS